MVHELHAYRLFTQGGYPRMGHKYYFINVKNRLHSLFQFVWDITGQGQMSFIGRARTPGPTCLKYYSAHGVLMYFSCILQRVAR